MGNQEFSISKVQGKYPLHHLTIIIFFYKSIITNCNSLVIGTNNLCRMCLLHKSNLTFL